MIKEIGFDGGPSLNQIINKGGPSLIDIIDLLLVIHVFAAQDCCSSRERVHKEKGGVAGLTGKGHAHCTESCLIRTVTFFHEFHDSVHDP